MSSPEPGSKRGQRTSGDTATVGAVDAIKVLMSVDEADAFTVLLAEAVAAWKAHSEQTHSARLNAMHFRALENKVTQIREQLPDSYPKRLEN